VRVAPAHRHAIEQPLHCDDVRLAERKAGELLKKEERAKGGRPSDKNPSPSVGGF
jgi:hypothetical protein